MRRGLVMIVLANGWALSAHATPATTIDWGPHDPVETASVQPKGNTDDFIRFRLTDDVPELFSTAVSSQPNVTNEGKGGTVSLYRVGGESDALVDSYDYDAGTANTLHALGAQAAGDYYYLVDSTGPGASGGAYTIKSSLSAPIASAALAAVPLPEPATLGILSLGLASLLSIRRSRN